MDVIITEKRLTEVLHKYLNSRIEGFDKCDYDWADFGCGMGVCCDPYAVNFVLDGEDRDNDYLFKLVDGEFYDDDGNYPEEMTGDLPEVCYSTPNIENVKFDTIILNEEMFEIITKMFGNINIWRDSLLSILNNTYGLNAKTLLYRYS
jgi:hypothetical protein